MKAVGAPPPSGPVVRATTSVEIDAATALVEGVFPYGSGFVRAGDRFSRVDLIVEDLDAAERLLSAVTAMTERLRVQAAHPRTAPATALKAVPTS